MTPDDSTTGEPDVPQGDVGADIPDEALDLVSGGQKMTNYVLIDPASTFDSPS